VIDVGVPLQATPTETAPAETKPLGRGDAAYGGGARATDVDTERLGDVTYPADNTLGQPTDPNRT
jgi:hypothetical protein